MHALHACMHAPGPADNRMAWMSAHVHVRAWLDIAWLRGVGDTPVLGYSRFKLGVRSTSSGFSKRCPACPGTWCYADLDAASARLGAIVLRVDTVIASLLML